jgi:hypothetical protein
MPAVRPDGGCWGDQYCPQQWYQSGPFSHGDAVVSPAQPAPTGLAGLAADFDWWLYDSWLWTDVGPYRGGNGTFLDFARGWAETWGAAIAADGLGEVGWAGGSALTKWGGSALRNAGNYLAPRGPLFGPQGPLFGRGGSAFFNGNDYVRVGWGWKGPAIGGKEVFRLAIGNKNAPIHWHFP